MQHQNAFPTCQKLLRTLRRLVLAAALCALFALPAAADAATTVRVGVFPLGQFMQLDAAGNAYGYNIDCLNRIAEETHWSYEYVACDNWVDATAKLEAGKIDLLAPAQRTDALAEKFDYAALYMGTEAAAIYTNAARDDLLYEDFSTMNGLTFGVAEGSTFATLFEQEYCVTHGFRPTIKSYANTTELLAALKDGAVDAIVTNIMFAEDSLKLLGWYAPLPVYYITQKGSTALLRALDTAMTSMLVESPSFLADLEHQYFPLFSNTQFSYDEKAYAASLPTVTVGYAVNHAPLSDQNEDGEFVGITRDILDRISEISGIRFAYAALPATNVDYTYLKENHIDVLCDVEYNDLNLSITQMHLSSPYLSSEKVLVTRDKMDLSTDSDLTIALATGSATLGAVIQQEYPNFTLETYDSLTDCFDAVRDGKADGCITNRYVADSVLESPVYAGLSVLPIELLSDELCIATMDYGADGDALCAQLNDGTFISIMDKCIAQLSNKEINNIIISGTANFRYQYTLWDFLRQYNTVLMVITAAILIGLGSLVRVQQVTAAKNKELAGKNNQLADAVAQADRASAAKSQFLSRMSHEIRTPMNAIVGLTEIARHHEGEPDKIEDYLSKIDVSSKVLLNIINDVLDMSAIENNKLKLANSEFDIKSVLSGLSTIYYPQCQSKGISFVMATDLPDEHFIGDSLRLNQILLNLVSNAYKFTPEGGEIKILAKRTTRRENIDYLRFTVSDTGCGMAPDMLDRLFKPFEQESADTARKHGGSGLGLSIAKNLVDMMDGSIKVESTLGKGTTFTVDLPFPVVVVEKDDVSAQLAKLHALVVDDDPSALEYTSLVLKRIGVPYDTASSGKEALALLRRADESGCPYRICLVDWKMPDMDGIEVTRAIRAQESQRTLIIIVSAYDLNEVSDDAKAAGADRFIAKPLFQSTVFDALINLTQGSAANLPADPSSYDFTGHRVLLAEDNEMNAQIAAGLLDMVHLAVDRVDNGQKAVDAFAASTPGQYDAVLMDVQMPVMDGYEATRALRALPRDDAKTIPIFAMTANAFNEDVAAAMSAGMNGHISKPIDTKALYKTLGQAIL